MSEEKALVIGIIITAIFLGILNSKRVNEEKEQTKEAMKKVDEFIKSCDILSAEEIEKKIIDDLKKEA